jgi:hypothetical protein
VTGRATIDHAKFRQPDLLNSANEMMLQGRTVGTRRNKFSILALIMVPFIEEIFSRRYRQTN